MQKTRQNKFGASLLLLVLTVIVVLYISHRARGNLTYHGKSLQWWLFQHYQNDIYERKTTDDEIAIRAIGTNGIPYLLRECFAQDSKRKQAFLDWIPTEVRLRLHLLTADERSEVAAEGLRVLGEKAVEGVGKLTLALNSSDTDKRYLAASALGVIGPPAESSVSSLIDHMYDSNENVQITVRHALGKIHRRLDVVVPALIDSLDMSHRTNWSYGASIVVLGEFGAEARTAIPYLVPFLNSSNLAMRQFTVDAIKQIDIQAAGQLGLK